VKIVEAEAEAAVRVAGRTEEVAERVSLWQELQQV
jgi:hypothetical protein